MVSNSLTLPELRFALENGYTLVDIVLAYSFERGVHTFLELINE
jgi:hypothetical protein